MLAIPKAHHYYLELLEALIKNILKKELEKVIKKNSKNIIYLEL